MSEVTQPGSIAITGADNIEHARWLAVRSALKLEIRGLRRSRGPSARVLANQITGKRGNARNAYAALDAHITAALGEDLARPLPADLAR